MGVPLAIGAMTGGRAKSFAYSFFVFLAYYLLMVPGQTLGEEGTLTPAVGMWLPNIILGCVGIGLYIKIALE